MKITPLLKMVLDHLGLDVHTVASQIGPDTGHRLQLHDTHGPQIAELIAPADVKIAYFNVLFVNDDVLACDFLTYDGDSRNYVDLRTWGGLPDKSIQHYIEVEMSPGSYDAFTPSMLQAIEHASGADYDRMPDRNGQPMSTVATLPRLIGDLVISSVQDTSIIRFDAEGDQPAWSIPYIRCMTDVTLVDLDETILPLAA